MHAQPGSTEDQNNQHSLCEIHVIICACSLFCLIGHCDCNLYHLTSRTDLVHCQVMLYTVNVFKLPTLCEVVPGREANGLQLAICHKLDV